MNKIKKLQKSVEHLFLNKDWPYRKLVQLSAYIVRVLGEYELNYYTNYAGRRIAALGLNDTDSSTVTRAALNTLKHYLGHKETSRATALLPTKSVVNITVAAMADVVKNAGSIVGVQTVEPEKLTIDVRRFVYVDTKTPVVREKNLFEYDYVSPFAGTVDAPPRPTDFYPLQIGVKPKATRLKTAMNLEAQSTLIVEGGEALSELEVKLAKEIADEIVETIIGSIRLNSRNVQLYYSINGDIGFTVDTLTKIVKDISECANSIGTEAHLKSANFAICDDATVNLLNTVPGFNFVPTADAETNGFGHVGTLNDSVEIYRHGSQKDEIIVGYKGESASDTGLVYVPCIGLALGYIEQPEDLHRPVQTLYNISDVKMVDPNYYRVLRFQPKTEALFPYTEFPTVNGLNPYRNL